MKPWLNNWLERHQHPASRVLHAVGIPLLAAGLILGLVQLCQWRWDLWWRPTGLIIVSYLLQWLGHRVEGNDLGEVVLLKKLLGRPYVAVSPRFSTPNNQTEPATPPGPGAESDTVCPPVANRFDPPVPRETPRDSEG